MKIIIKTQVLLQAFLKDILSTVKTQIFLRVTDKMHSYNCIAALKCVIRNDTALYYHRLQCEHWEYWGVVTNRQNSCQLF